MPFAFCLILPRLTLLLLLLPPSQLLILFYNSHAHAHTHTHSRGRKRAQCRRVSKRMSALSLTLSLCLSLFDLIFVRLFYDSSKMKEETTTRATKWRIYYSTCLTLSPSLSLADCRALSLTRFPLSSRSDVTFVAYAAN